MAQSDGTLLRGDESVTQLEQFPLIEVRKNFIQDLPLCLIECFCCDYGFGSVYKLRAEDVVGEERKVSDRLQLDLVEPDHLHNYFSYKVDVL